MKVLFTISYYTPYVSGLTIHVRRVAEAFVKRGHSVRILTTRHSKSLAGFAERDGLKLIRVPYLYRFHKGFLMPLYPLYAWRAIKNAEVIIINLPQFESLIATVFAKIQNKPLYAIYHCEVVLPGGIKNKLIQLMLQAVHFITLIWVNKIVTYTQDYARHSALLPFFSAKVIPVYPPVPIPVINKTESIRMRKNIPAETEYVIGVAARFAAEKGIGYLLNAIPHLEKKLGRNFIILFAGPEHPVGEEIYYRQMRGLLHRYADYLLFLGTVEPSEMGSFYTLLDVLVLPSINATEAFGMVQVEAMMCGVPVVASDLPGVRVPVMVTKMGELAKPKDSADLALKITKVVKNKKVFPRLAKQAIKIFSFNDTISRYEKIFRIFS